MLTIEVRLLHETIRAASPDDIVMTGDRPVGEWPPSPARVFSALVAADGTRDRCRVTTGEELAALEALPPPLILASGLRSVATTELPARYVVKGARASGITQEYPARINTLVHPGVRMSPETPRIIYVWDADLDPPTLDALRERAARVGYLGTSDSPVMVSVGTETPEAEIPEWQMSDHGPVSLPVPYAGFTGQLDAAFDAWSSGRPSRRAWIRTERARYGLRSQPDEDSAGPTTLWFRFDRPVHGHKALRVSEAVRRTVLDRYQRVVLPGERGTVPWVLHGHDIPPDVVKPYQLARYMTLAHVGSRHADGRIHGCAVWLPPDTSAEVIEGVRRSLWGWARIRSNSIDVGVDAYAGELRPWSVSPIRWKGPSHTWRSVTPLIAERGVNKRGPAIEQIRAWFNNAGHESPTHATALPVPTIEGAARLRPSEVRHRPGPGAYPYFWLDVHFDEPQTGPICVGRGRHLGIGLFAPVSERKDKTIAIRDGGV